MELKLLEFNPTVSDYEPEVVLRLHLCLRHSMMVALQPPFSRSLDPAV